MKNILGYAAIGKHSAPGCLMTLTALTAMTAAVALTARKAAK